MFYIAILGLFLSVGTTYAQKVAVVNSEIIRKYYPDAKQAEQRIQSFVDEWYRELEVREQEIKALEFEIKKNRLIWTVSEKEEKEKELKNRTKSRDEFAQTKFTPDGEYDNLAKNMLGPIEGKIRAAINEVAADYRFDVIIDQSITPLPYVNYKYDMTINVLRKLGVDTKELEAELKEKIEKDPRNKETKTKTPRTRGRNTRRPDSDKPEEGESLELNNENEEVSMPEEGSDLTPEQKIQMEKDLKKQAEEIEKAKKEREKKK